MTGVTVSGSLLSSFVIDRDGDLETVTPTNAADNEEPSPFSVELHFVSPEAAEAVGASAARAAASLRALAASPDGAPVEPQSGPVGAASGSLDGAAPGETVGGA